jgi:CRISPR-associated protein Csx10
MKIKMELLSDTVFGNGESIPGGEDIAVQCDENGFPYYRGTTFKGVFREEYIRLLTWEGKSQSEISQLVGLWLGQEGSDNQDESKLIFSDFQLSDMVKKAMQQQIGKERKAEVLDALTHIRSFTSISEDGVAKEGSLRQCRCVNKGLFFYSEIQCRDEKTK